MIRWLLMAIAALAVTLIVVLLVSTFRATPRSDRDWTAGLAQTARFADRDDGTYRLVNYRDWGTEPQPPAGAWQSRIVDPAQTVGLWFYVDFFSGWDGVAHTFLVFELEAPNGLEYLSVSVEARREKGEAYSAVKGLFRTYELAYVWSSERDQLIRRAVVAGETVRGYRLNVSPDAAEAVLRAFIAETNDLAAAPRFYNTLFSNCTNALARTVNAMQPGRVIPWHYSFVLPGFADRYLHRLGYIGDASVEFETVSRNAVVTETVRNLADRDSDAFSRALHRRP